MSDEKTFTTLEGLGYTAAIMIGVAGWTRIESLYYFNVAGLVFGIIVIVRLLVMNARIALGYRYLTQAPEASGSNPGGQAEHEEQKK